MPSIKRTNILVMLLLGAASYGQKSTATLIADYISREAAHYNAQFIDAANGAADGDRTYYLDVAPFVNYYMATLDDSRLDLAEAIVEEWISTATIVNGDPWVDSYLGWPSTGGSGTGTVNGDEVALAQSRGWKSVARMLWVMSESPGWLAKGDNQASYNAMLAFTETHIWEKWRGRTSTDFWIYRSQTHMASHWAQIAWYLAEITGDAEYRTVYDNIMTDGMGSFNGNDYMLQHIFARQPSGPGAIWNSDWAVSSGATTVAYGEDEVQIMSWAIERSEGGDVSESSWTSTQRDRLVYVLENVIDVGTNQQTTSGFPNFIDGTGTRERFIEQGWVTLGKYSQSLQNDLTSMPYKNRTNDAAFIAHLLYNQFYLDGGIAWVPGGGTPPDIPLPPPVAASKLRTQTAQLIAH